MPDLERGNLPSSSTTTDIPSTSAVNLDNVALPPKSKKRGRPKGTNNTVIGLPNRKELKINKPTPFIKKSSNDRDYQILSYFVSEEDINFAMNGQHLSESSVEQNPAAVSRACLDENISIQKVRRNFDNDGWAAVEQIYDALKSAPDLCVHCKKDLFIFHDFSWM